MTDSFENARVKRYEVPPDVDVAALMEQAREEECVRRASEEQRRNESPEQRSKRLKHRDQAQEHRNRTWSDKWMGTYPRLGGRKRKSRRGS